MISPREVRLTSDNHVLRVQNQKLETYKHRTAVLLSDIVTLLENTTNIVDARVKIYTVIDMFKAENG